MKIVFAIAEVDPFVKTGGLGDVGGYLPAALQKQGADVRVILPNHSVIPSHYRREFREVARFSVPVAWRRQYCGLKELVLKGVHYYFIDNEYYFKRSHIYGNFDEAEQYAFFSRAVLESMMHIPAFRPDVIHCHDWHTALIPLLLKVFYAQEPLYNPVKTVFTIHNLKYQGVFPKEVLGDILGLGDEFFTADTLEFSEGVNFMKAGLLYADRLTTVSPTYALEIQHAYYGESLEGVLQRRSAVLSGILNGVDYELYDPERDPYLVGGLDGSTQAKAKNKKFLQTQMGLPARPGIPVLGMVTRLVEQKGLDLLAHVLAEILQLDVQMVILGAGEQCFADLLNNFCAQYPEKLAVRMDFDDRLAHRIYAGADIFLMPSRFEPCGISQMIAMHYGTVPIVRETGGLKDTVIPYNEFTDEGTGFSFTNYNAHELLYTVQRAVKIFREEKPVWKKIRSNALHTNFSWEGPAQAYMKIYQKLV